MALSGSVVTTGYNGRTVTLNWSAAQSVADNSSVITWNLVGSGPVSGWVVVSELRIKINDTQVYYRSSSNHTNCYNGTQLASGTTTIAHNADGSKSLSISVEAGIYQWAINCRGSGTFTLDTIARASSITSAGNVTLGNACSVQWTPASSAFTYKLKFLLGNWSYTTGIISPAGTSAYTYTGFVIPLEVAKQIPGAVTSTMTVYLYSYNGNTQIGSVSSKTFAITIPATVKPTIGAVAAAIDNSGNSVINSWGIAVAGYTRVKVTANASGAQGSTISTYTVSGGYNISVSGASLSYTGGAIASSGSKSFTVTAKDSRGRTSDTKASNAITFYAYSRPSISAFSVSRLSGNESKIVVFANWSFASVNNKNSATAVLQYKKSSSSGWTTYGAIARNTSVTLTPTFEKTSSYNFRLTVSDALNNQAQNEAFISTIGVLMDLKAGGKGIAFGKISETDNLVESAWRIKADKGIVSDDTFNQGSWGAPTYGALTQIIDGSNAQHSVIVGRGKNGTRYFGIDLLDRYTDNIMKIQAGEKTLLIGYDDLQYNDKAIIDSGNISSSSISFTIPVSKGGTGAKTAAAARSSLGLLSAVQKNAGDYWGIGYPDGTAESYIRTPKSGIIPYQAGGYGNVGTSAWPFVAVHAQEGHFNNLSSGNGWMRIGSYKICWGSMTVKYAATTASGNHYYGSATSISGGTFASAFSSVPTSVILTTGVGTTSMFGVEVSAVTASAITGLRIHRANSYTDTAGVKIYYVAFGAI